MTPPVTSHEAGGSWTSLAQERTFFDQILAETDLTETLVGHSIQDRAIYAYALGQGPEQTLMITSLVHGNEPASREAVLAMIRDMAYATDPQVVDYLAAHRIVWVPSISPDSAFFRRNNAVDANPNRDFYGLTQPETRAVVTAINAFSPHLIVDCHEYWTDGPEWMGFEGHMPGAHGPWRGSFSWIPRPRSQVTAMTHSAIFGGSPHGRVRLGMRRLGMRWV